MWDGVNPAEQGSLVRREILRDKRGLCDLSQHWIEISDELECCGACRFVSEESCEPAVINFE